MAREYGRMKTVFGIECDNFDLYFEKQMIGLTQKEIEGVPKDVSSILFKADHTLNIGKAKKLPFLAKQWLLWRCKRKRIYVVVEDEETGLDLDGFKKLQEALTRRDYGVARAQTLTADGTFITGNRQLCDTFEYLNNLSVSPAYNYLNKPKNYEKTNTGKFVEQMGYITRFLQHYESNKKKWVEEKQVSLPEFLVMIYLYDKEEVNPAPMHKQVYRRSYHSSTTQIKKAYRSLQARNLIVKHSSGRWSKMQITPMGRALISSILNNYALNC